MIKKQLYIDVALLIVIGCLFSYSIWQHFINNLVLTLNFYLGIICWLTVFYLKIRRDKKAAVSVLILLVLSSFNIVSFYFVNFTIGVSTIQTYHSFYFYFISINPISILVMVVYALINRAVSISFFRNMVSNSDTESEYRKKAKFYYDTFTSCSEDELNYAIKNIKDYPEPAQEALKIVIEQRSESKSYKLEEINSKHKIDLGS